MSTYETSDEHRPLLWLRGYPVYAAHFIVMVLVVSMLATTALNLFGATAVLRGMTFYSAAVLRGEVWRVLTYGLVNQPSIWFAIQMAMVIWFGREVERNFGRRTFLFFYGGLYLLTPLLLTLLGLWRPMALEGETGSFGVFIAFATLYPTVPMFFNLTAQWMAVILVGIYTLMALNGRDVLSLVSLWATTVFAFVFVRYQQGRWAFSLPAMFRRGPKLRVLPDVKPEPKAGKKIAKPAEVASAASMAEVDALLDKIAAKGISSLTAKERAKLDAARAELLKRESGRR